MRLYLPGLGMPQNYVKAHMRFNKAAAERDALAGK
jgi:TPR repeat protein